VVITVSRKDVPLAVTRNRIRRRIRAALAKTGSKPTHAVMIIGNARVAKAPFKELLEELNKTFRHHE
jgi:ribonuclease P protein component